MAGRLIHRHDQFFKRLLDQPGAAGALLRERLPPDLAERLSDDPPELLPDSYVSDTLAEHRSDRLYRVRTREQRALLIHVLVEHKSTPDPDVAYQLFVYQARILERWRRTEPQAPPPAVVSLVVYHGAAPWRAPLTLGEFLTDDPALRPHLLDFRYRLIDLGHIPDVMLSHDPGLRIGFLTLKYGGRDGASRDQLLTLARAAWSLGRGDFIVAMRYILGEPNDVTEALVRDVLREITPEPTEPLMSIMLETYKEKWLIEGRAEGLSQGFSQGLSQGVAQGISQGAAEGRIALLSKLAARRFGPLPPQAQRRISQASPEELDRWGEMIFDAPSLDAWLR